MAININQFDNYGNVVINETKDKTQQETRSNYLLQLVGDVSFGQKDFLSLRRTGYKITKLDILDINDLESHIVRMRSQNQFTKNWHISSHANKNFIYFNNIPVQTEWFIERLNYQEIDVLFIDACESIYFADQLVGMAKYIFSVFHKIYDTDGEKVAYYFWNQIYQGIEPRQAVANVQILMPQIGQYFWIN